jgi:hypothetical protein
MRREFPDLNIVTFFFDKLVSNTDDEFVTKYRRTYKKAQEKR